MAECLFVAEEEAGGMDGLCGETLSVHTVFGGGGALPAGVCLVFSGNN